MSLRLPVLSLAPDVLDAYALRAAQHGDREAEAAAISALTPLLLWIVDGVIRGGPRLLEHREELIQEALLAATVTIRRYDGRCRLVTYVGVCVRGRVKTAARAVFSPVGAKTPGTRGIDFAAPAFQGYAPVGPGAGDRDDDDGDGGGGVVAFLAAPAAAPHPFEAARLTRLRLMKRLQKLLPVERDVVMRRWGVASRRDRATKNAWARQRALAIRPESLEEIGVTLGVSGEAVRIIQVQALAKLGIQEGPQSVRRRRAAKKA